MTEPLTPGLSPHIRKTFDKIIKDLDLPLPDMTTAYHGKGLGRYVIYNHRSGLTLTYYKPHSKEPTEFDIVPMPEKS